MKRLLTTAAALMMLAGTAGAGLAQPYDRGHDDHHPAMQGPAMHGPAMHGPSMRGPAHAGWRKGGHIAHNDWNRGRHVDYRSHHLRTPPRGYEWREVDGNYVLAAVATGLIASVILANQ